MATYLLVHGSWAGGWIWDRVRPLLEEAGHRVLSPTLTGLAERCHLAGPEVGLNVHVQDVAEVLRDEGLDNVILVGHSYGGMVITGTAALAPDAIGQLVYVDAFAPVTGDSAFSLLPWLTDLFVAAEDAPDWEVEPPTPEILGADDEGAAWLSGRLTSMPLPTHTEPLGPGSEPVLANRPVTYIHCAGQPLFDAVAASAEERGFRLVTFPEITHVNVLSQPEALAVELLSLA
ncbi:alpha/beta fold hydrolase [Streptomyces globisporus]|uniref:alpha/beta fold hydrolase n=1 Tax=Streptomyces globisporus TaxID=1908 RepID=UPI00379D7A88